MTSEDKPQTHAVNERQGSVNEKISSEHVEIGKGEVFAEVDYSGTAKKTDRVEIKLVRKLDLIIMPTLWIMYWFNYLDRNAITVARLDGMEKELGLKGTEYQTCVSVLFAGYILGQLPANMLITRVRPSWFMAGWMALWAVRRLSIRNGALYMLSIFYTKKEIATRISILFTGNICGTALAGLIAIGVFQMSDIAGLSGWRWLFIIQGIATFVLAIASAFILPDEPLTTRWLSPDQRQLAHDRILRDTVQSQSNTTVWTALKEAERDPRLWVLVAMQHFHMTASNFKNFFPTIVETLGFSRNVTLALTCPPYLIAGVISIAYAANSGRMNERTWHITISKVVAVFGFILACTTLNTGARYFAMCTFTTGVYCCNSIILGWVASTCGQTKEKKSISLALVNTIATIGFIYNPYFWPSDDQPRYTIAMSASAAYSVVAAIFAWILRFMLVKENRKIRASHSEETMFYAY
ncbi:unnamed protein product [Clonostachys rosea]|uniref:Major facilitator superfamily (MFS) profile domain-containing protein n=1 Tax=Bionectria ochroleuca TaxID=29856 RepID=A0ABY6UWY6_BIOOC|nr:unnamed protein product [Clonostachys rosea]